MSEARQPGSIIDDKYEVLEPLASGGMGDIHLVRHLHLDQKRVIKILRQELASSESALKRFQREARLATEIKHTNVAILYDFAQLPDDSFYMVWEHIEGNDVGHWLRQYGPFPLQAALQLSIQALRGLGEIHASGIIHRDISPDNLMITRGSRSQYVVKIIDLGLAKSLEPDPRFDVTQAGMFMGKLQYCSPEQAGLGKVENLDHRTDLYSFGLVLYEMITGMPPFVGASPQDVIFKRLSEDPLPLAGRNPAVQVPAELEGVMSRLLSRDRGQRHADAGELIRALAPIEESLRQAATQLVRSGSSPTVKPSATAAAKAPTAPASPAPTSPAPATPRETPAGTPADAPAQAPGGGSSDASKPTSSINQIDEAAERVKETSRLIDLAEEALKLGNLDEVDKVVARLEEAQPGAPGLEALRNRLQRKRDQEQIREQVKEAEGLVDKYLKQGHKTLADMALETLLEMHPTHPRREDFENWVEILGEEETQKERAEEALNIGREAIERGDFKTARKQMETAARFDPSGRLVEPFMQELEEAQQELTETEEFEERKKRFEAALEAAQLDDAEAALRSIADLGIPKLTLSLYSNRLEEARAREKESSVSGPYDERFQRCCEAGDWEGARDAARGLNDTLPNSRRAAEMFAEVDRLQRNSQRQSSLDQGVRQIEASIAAGDADGATLALRILVQMAPQDPRWAQLQSKIQALR